MDYFSQRQAIALPLDSDKEPLTAEFTNTTTPDRPSPPASRKSKLKKALKISVPLLLIGILLGWVLHARFPKTRFGRFIKTWFNRDPFPHMDFEVVQWVGPSGSSNIVRHGSHMRLSMTTLDADYKSVQCDAVVPWSGPEDIVNSDRYNTKPRFSSNATLNFPLSSKSLLFYAYGSYSVGDIAFVEDNAINSDDIAVVLNVHYWSQEDLDKARVCTLDRASGMGLGIFTQTRDHTREQDELQFKITVRFPKSSDGKPVNIKKLETILPMFAHHFPMANIHFDSLSVKTTHFPIMAESLSVKSATLQTTTSEIIGHYNVTDYLELRTTEGFVFVNVSMNNANRGVPTRLSVESRNAPLLANVSLFSNDGIGGDFAVDASTSNSVLQMEVPVAPIDHILHLSAKNSESLARVDLPSTYEGAFYLSSSTSRPHIEFKNDRDDDPKGEGRQRRKIWKNTGHEIAGDIRWMDSDKVSYDKEMGGSVEVITQVLDAHLSL